MKYVRILITYVIRFFLRCMCIFPIKKNRIVFNSMFWKQYSCNPRYISEYLEKNYKDKFEIIWSFKEPKKFEYLKERKIVICKVRTLRYYFYNMTAAVIVCNATIGAEIPHRKKQYRINTWHGGGGGYKKIDYGNTFKFRARLECRETDLYCASSQTSLENTVRIAFKHNGEFFGGTPRNDMLINGDREDIKNEVYRFLNIDKKKKIVLYAPTYREGANARNYDDKKYDYGLDYIRLKKSMETRFNGNWVVAVRFHPRISKYQLPDNEEIIDATKYPDMQELLATVDAMVTDYSSSLWDFSFTYKPCFLFCEDLEEYKEKRGFNKPIEEWGFPISLTNDELETKILLWDKNTHVANMDRQHIINGSFEDGHATERICKLISEKCSSL